MKGPAHRLKFDFSRRWECPVCHARARTSGAVTSMICPCSEPSDTVNLMLMVYDGEPMLPFREQTAVASTAAPASEHLE